MNIIHGAAAGGSFKQAFHVPNEEILMFSDVLSCGPLKEFTNIETWKRDRQVFWSNLEDYNSLEKDVFSFGSFYRDLYNEFEDLKNANEFKLWIGTGLSDQLLLAFLINLLDLFNLDLDKLSIFQFEKFHHNQSEIRGLGMLNPEQIKTHPQPYTLTEQQITYAKSAWHAVAADSPDEYLRFINSKNQCMPLLKRAMAYLLFRYPKSTNGLSHWDETLLKYTAEHEPKAARIIGYTLGDCSEGLDWVGDFYLFSRLKNMGRPHLNAPLVEANALDLHMRDTQIRILPNGLEALADKLNVIKSNGIDDWVGGVHLDSSSGGVWLRKNETLFHQIL